MKRIYLDKEEREILESFERGEWRPGTDLEGMKKKLAAAARNTILKDQRINIRLAAMDLTRIRSRAMEEGIPYQTLISSILHKYANGTLGKK